MNVAPKVSKKGKSVPKNEPGKLSNHYPISIFETQNVIL